MYFYCTYLHTHKHTILKGGRAGRGPRHGLWVITDDTYGLPIVERKHLSLQKVLKSLPPRMLSSQIGQLFFVSFQSEEVVDKRLSHAYSVGVSTVIHVRQNDPTSPEMQCDTMTCSWLHCFFSLETRRWGEGQ